MSRLVNLARDIENTSLISVGNLFTRTYNAIVLSVLQMTVQLSSGTLSSARKSKDYMGTREKSPE